jgi:hypothetical protein
VQKNVRDLAQFKVDEEEEEAGARGIPEAPASGRWNGGE